MKCCLSSVVWREAVCVVTPSVQTYTVYMQLSTRARDKDCLVTLIAHILPSRYWATILSADKVCCHGSALYLTADRLYYGVALRTPSHHWAELPTIGA